MHELLFWTTVVSLELGTDEDIFVCLQKATCFDHLLNDF